MKLKEVFDKFETTQDFFDAVDSELKKLSEANKDFKYIQNTDDGDCKYNSGPSKVLDRCSGCIFGQALFALGWDDSDERNVICDIKELFWTNVFRVIIHDYD
jgi:hypothetical protein